MSRFFHFLASSHAQVWHLTLEHFFLVLVATGGACVVGIPTGILLTRFASLRKPVLAFANMVQTIPSLALFGFLIPILGSYGIGKIPALIALFLYSLLPIIQNTFTGISGIDPAVRQAGRGMGMTDWQLLVQVDIPLSLDMILAGVRVATVISVGTATIAAAIGAGGLGVLIFRGLRMNDNTLILAGAVPAALMALVADFLLGAVQQAFSAWKLEEPIGPVKAREQSWVRFPLVAGGVIAILLLLSLFSIHNLYVKAEDGTINIGAKDFTEQEILGEILAEAIESGTGLSVKREFELGGDLCHRALVAGDIDGYVEYTGTAYTAILQHKPISNAQVVYDTVREEYDSRWRLKWLPPLGFNNTFAILVRQSTAEKDHLKRISDIIPYAPDWRVAFGQDFMSRKDGYAGFIKAYGLRFKDPPLEMDLSLTYRALADGQVDLIAGNSTDGRIKQLHLYQLEDNRHYFPPYEAAPVFREDTLRKYPAVERVLLWLSGKISNNRMREMNYEVDGEHRNIKEVAREFLRSLSVNNGPRTF